MKPVTRSEFEARISEWEREAMTSPAEREVEAGMAAERRKAIDAMNELATIAEITKPLDARRDLLREQVRQYLALEGMDTLTDGETGVVARIQEREGAALFDLVSATEQHPDAVLAAGKAGMLRLDGVMLKRFRGDSGAHWADVVAEYAMPGKTTSALYIEKGSR